MESQAAWQPIGREGAPKRRGRTATMQTDADESQVLDEALRLALDSKDSSAIGATYHDLGAVAVTGTVEVPGLCEVEVARRYPVRLLESGPAGGAILAASVAGAVLRGDSDEFRVSDGITWGLGGQFPSRSNLRAMLEAKLAGGRAAR